MIRVDAKKPVHFCDGLTRRDFLHAGSLSVLGLGLPAMQALAASGSVAPDRDVNCILLFLVGGPSQLDTWDMKPDAPEEIRGPFRPIATKVPGVQVSEIFPRLATMMDKVSLVRSVYHTAAAVHDTGHQMMQTGRLFARRDRASALRLAWSPSSRGRGNDTPPYVLLPKPIGPTGGNLPHGHAAGYLGKTLRPVHLERRPQRQGVQGARPAAAGLRHGRARVAAAVAALGDRRGGRRVRVVGRRPAARCQLRRGVQADVEPAGARGVRHRRRAGRRSATATAAPGSARAACWPAG